MIVHPEVKIVAVEMALTPQEAVILLDILTFFNENVKEVDTVTISFSEDLLKEISKHLT